MQQVALMAWSQFCLVFELRETTKAERVVRCASRFVRKRLRTGAVPRGWVGGAPLSLNPCIRAVDILMDFIGQETLIVCYYSVPGISAATLFPDLSLCRSPTPNAKNREKTHRNKYDFRCLNGIVRRKPYPEAECLASINGALRACGDQDVDMDVPHNRRPRKGRENRDHGGGGDGGDGDGGPRIQSSLP